MDTLKHKPHVIVSENKIAGFSREYHAAINHTFQHDRIPGDDLIDRGNPRYCSYNLLKTKFYEVIYHDLKKQKVAYERTYNKQKNLIKIKYYNSRGDLEVRWTFNDGLIESISYQDRGRTEDTYSSTGDGKLVKQTFYDGKGLLHTIHDNSTVRHEINEMWRKVNYGERQTVKYALLNYKRGTTPLLMFR